MAEPLSWLQLAFLFHPLSFLLRLLFFAGFLLPQPTILVMATHLPDEAEGHFVMAV